MVSPRLPRRFLAGFRGKNTDNIFALFPLALLWLVFFGVVPIVAAIITGMVQGTSVNGAKLPAPGYPAFPMMSCSHLVPALLIAVLFVRTFTWPLKTVDTIRRYEMALGSAFGAGVVGQSNALDQRFLTSWGAHLNMFTLSLFVALFVLSFARAAAGSLHLVPRSWRVEPSKLKRKGRP